MPEDLAPTACTQTVVMRLRPGEDLRLALESKARQLSTALAVVSGIGSLDPAVLRYAGATEPVRLPGPRELLSLAGTVCVDGAHLHALVADGCGAVLGGHICAGAIVATTAELVLLPLHGQSLARELDPATGYLELQVREIPASRIRR